MTLQQTRLKKNILLKKHCCEIKYIYICNVIIIKHKGYVGFKFYKTKGG